MPRRKVSRGQLEARLIYAKMKQKQKQKAKADKSSKVKKRPVKVKK